MLALERFHQAAPENKLQVVRTLDDARLRCLGERLIYEEWPATLPLDVHARLEAELRDRHLTQTERPWTTVSAALEAIDELLPSADDDGRKILLEYREYLSGLLPFDKPASEMVDASVPLLAALHSGGRALARQDGQSL